MRREVAVLAVRPVVQEGAGADEAVGPGQALQGLQGGEGKTEAEGEGKEVRGNFHSEALKVSMYRVNHLVS